MSSSWLSSWLPQLLQPLSTSAQKRSAGEAFGATERENGELHKAAAFRAPASLTPAKLDRPGVYRQTAARLQGDAGVSAEGSARKQRRLCSQPPSQRASHKAEVAGGLLGPQSESQFNFCKTKASSTRSSGTGGSGRPLPFNSQKGGGGFPRRPQGSLLGIHRNAGEGQIEGGVLKKGPQRSLVASSARRPLLQRGIEGKLQQTQPPIDSRFQEERRMLQTLRQTPLFAQERPVSGAAAGCLDTLAPKPATASGRRMAFASAVPSLSARKDAALSFNKAGSASAEGRARSLLLRESSPPRKSRGGALPCWGSSSALPLLKQPPQRTSLEGSSAQRSASASSLPLLSAMAAGAKKPGSSLGGNAFCREKNLSSATASTTTSVSQRQRSASGGERLLAAAPSSHRAETQTETLVASERFSFQVSRSAAYCERPSEAAGFPLSSLSARRPAGGAAFSEGKGLLLARRREEPLLPAHAAETPKGLRPLNACSGHVSAAAQTTEPDSSSDIFVTPKLSEADRCAGDAGERVHSTEKCKRPKIVYGHRVLKPLVSKRLDDNFNAFPEIQNHWKKYCEAQTLKLLTADKELVYYTRGYHHPLLAKRFLERSSSTASAVAATAGGGEKAIAEAVVSGTAPRARPKWAEGPMLESALRLQQRIDPFSVFGEAPPELVLPEVYRLQHYNAVSLKTLQRHPGLGPLLAERLRDGQVANGGSRSGLADASEQTAPFIGAEEWRTRLLPALESLWEAELAVELNWKNDPLTADEVVWYLQATGASSDLSEAVTVKQPCYCPTPPPNRNWVWTDSRHILSTQGTLFLPTPPSGPAKFSTPRLPSPKTPGLRRRRRRKLRASPVALTSGETKRRRRLLSPLAKSAKDKHEAFENDAPSASAPNWHLLRHLLSDAQKPFNEFREKPKTLTPPEAPPASEGSSFAVFSPRVESAAFGRSGAGSLAQCEGQGLRFEAFQRNAYATNGVVSVSSRGGGAASLEAGSALGFARRSPLLRTPVQSAAVAESTSNRWRAAVLREHQTFR